MSARFGPPPLSTLTVASLRPACSARDFRASSTCSILPYVGPSNRMIARMRDTDQLFFSEMLYAHEVAHQWWGNVVVSSGYQHDWLLEALSDYSALALFPEKHKGTRAVESVLNQYRADLLAKNPDGATMELACPTVSSGSRLEPSLVPQRLAARLCGEKGAWILHEACCGGAWETSAFDSLSRRVETPAWNGNRSTRRVSGCCRPASFRLDCGGLEAGRILRPRGRLF